MCSMVFAPVLSSVVAVADTNIRLRLGGMLCVGIDGMGAG